MSMEFCTFILYGYKLPYTAFTLEQLKELHEGISWENEDATMDFVVIGTERRNLAYYGKDNANEIWLGEILQMTDEHDLYYGHSELSEVFEMDVTNPFEVIKTRDMVIAKAKYSLTKIGAQIELPPEPKLFVFSHCF